MVNTVLFFVVILPQFQPLQDTKVLWITEYALKLKHK